MSITVTQEHQIACNSQPANQSWPSATSTKMQYQVHTTA